MNGGRSGAAALSDAAATAGATGGADAVAYLRRRTVARSFRAYREWVGRAVGWWTLVYLLAWLVVFVVAGLEALTPLADPLDPPRGVLAGGLALLFVSLAWAGRVPPVILDRRDLYRLGAAPVEPWLALRWRFTVKLVGAAALGAALGVVWTALAPALFGRPAPWAAPALALALVARFAGAWLRYGAGQAPAWGWAVAAGGVAVAVAPFGLADALSSASPVVLVLPAALAALALVLARRSLREEWPPRFAAQSLVLTQLQAMRTLQLMAGLAGFARQAAADGGERRRLLAALHDRPGATRPRRSLPLVSASAPRWQATAWRTASDLWRRSPPRLALAVLLAGAGAVAAVLANHGAAPVQAGAATPAAGTAAGLLGGAVGVLLAALVVARAGSSLLGPEFALGALPVEPTDRSLGRVAPGATLMLAFALGAAAWFGVGGAGLVGATSLILIVLFALEKYATWSGSGSGRWEAQVVAAILAALPSLVLAAFGVPGWTVGTQVGLLLVVLLVAV